MLGLLLAAYSVTPLMTVPNWMRPPGIRDSVALGGNGTVALIPQSSKGPPAQRVLIIRADGSRVWLPMIPDAILKPADVFRHWSLGAQKYPFKRFISVSVADDGTPFVTLASSFSGAYSGQDEGPFFWNGRWHAAFLQSPAADPSSWELAAAQSISRFVVNGNYANLFVNLDYATAPHYEEDQIAIFDGPRIRVLGYGDATAMRWPFIVGAEPGAQALQADNPPQLRAIEIAQGQRTILGRGIARAVNAFGDAVGDDELWRNGPGHPTLWRKGRTIRLTTESGTAYAITDDDRIVGQVNNRGFIARRWGTGWRMMRLDQLLNDRTWHVMAAYAIAPNGLLVALARRPGTASKIVLLTPQRTP